MKTYQLNILGLCTALLLLTACEKDGSGREALAEGRVTFNLPASTDVVASPLVIKTKSVVSIEIKAALQGGVSSDEHYVGFATDTTKIADYRAKYGNSALLLPTTNYLFYKSTAAIAAGASLSEPAILNLGFQTSLKKFTTYVLPLVISSVDGVMQDPKTRRVVYYVFNTGDGRYVEHTGFTPTATATSTSGANVASRAIDANISGTYWASATTSALPQSLTIDYIRDVTFTGLDYYLPTAITTASGGFTTSAKIETSSNGTVWADKGTFAVDANNPDKLQTINLPAPATARFVRFTILSATPYVAGTMTYSVGFVGGILLLN
ncbi:MAG: discoidin domain-containing protein [Pedobacter sp.]|nr:discoidin domain-containing protein [Pedobacter sp.]MDQ8052218.1 discoidin domain-containing protein [Pedobacter sp.]